MQNKSFVSLFAIVFSVVCLYQLSFTWIAKGVEKDAVEYSNGDELREKAYLDSVASEPAYNIGLKNYTYSECKSRELNLGLDLKGGMNVTLEVSVVDVIRAMSNYNKDETFNAAIRAAIDKQVDSQDDFVTLFGQSFADLSPEGKLASIFYTPELKDKISSTSTNDEVMGVIRIEVEDAIDRSFNILRSRIDRFGVSQPNIQRLEGSGRILVELPGVKDPERVRKLLQGTAQLEFWETYENTEILGAIDQVNAYLKSQVVVEEEVVEDAQETAEETSIEEDFDTDLAIEDLSTNSEASSDSAALSAEQFSKENPLYAVLFPNLNQSNQPNEGPVCGISSIKDTAQVNAYLNMDEVKNILPRDVRFVWTVKPYDPEGRFVQLVALRVTSRDGKAAMEGDVVTDARTDFGQLNGSPEVSMAMNAEGARMWKRLTADNIGKSVAIVLDDYVYSYPTVQAEISGGRSQITGNFTINEANDLSNILKSGKLPAPARIIEEAIVGPSLGQEAIDSGLRSFIIALSIVLLYMMFYYSFAGLVSNVALLANLFFVFGVLSSLGAVLTLPGIAGIVLTIGMSVDANVLIYERIREELLNGKGLKLAVSDGYKNAYSSIIDANVTTLLTGIILYIFGSGPIKGFATTLVIGILTSLFSAIFITRLILQWRLEKKGTASFDNSITRGAFKNTAIDFLGKRKLFYGISSLIILIGIGSLATKKLNYGVDFKGGRTFVVRFDVPVDNEAVRNSLANYFVDDSGLKMFPEVKTFGDNNQVKITTKYLIDSKELTVDAVVAQQLDNGLAIIGDYEIMSSQKVGPTIADDIKVSALWSILFSLLVIFLYILLRFRKWQFSLGAVAAVFHDVLIVLSIFSIFYGILPFSLEIDQAFIAALLTIIGYSLNDTVVVFDRIREHMNIFKKKEFNSLVNNALNSTLSRTVNTSLTTFFVLLVIFLFGGEVIRGFMFALMVGVLVGTYSSLFVASPIMVDTIKKTEENKK
ncbi:protein translocase subunit SecDF [Flavobacteriales bacterium]|nr:protein translocase subunit SecDF [Flavobacteriales bacterium]